MERIAKTSWSNILTGSFTALGVGLFLNVLGLAIGFSVLSNSESAAAGWLAVWSLIVPVVALFVGGIVGARTGSPDSRAHAAAEGVATWGFTYIIGIGMLFLRNAFAGGMRTGGVLGRFVADLSSGRLVNFDQTTVYMWFLCASIALALLGCIVGEEIGARRELLIEHRSHLGVAGEVRQ